MRRRDGRIGRDQRQDVFLLLAGQRFFEQFVHPHFHQLPRHAQDQQRHDDRRRGVCQPPAAAQEIGAADSDERAYRRERVAAVMPCVGHDRGAVDPSADARRVAIERFFGDDRYDGRPQCHDARLCRKEASREVADRCASAPQQLDSHACKRYADDERGQRFVFPVAVVVVVVARFGRNAHEEQHHQIGGEVRHRMDGVGHHGRAVSPDTCGKFPGAQYQIDCETDPCDAVDGLFAAEGSFCHSGRM